MQTDTLIVVNALVLGALLVIEALGLGLVLLRIHRASQDAHQKTQELLERMEHYRLVSVERRP